MDLKITPVIKKQRTRVEDFEVCPHCMGEIMEKSIYIDPENYVYHRPCKDKGPIEKLTPTPLTWGADGVLRAASKKPDGITKKAVITRSQWEKAGQKAGWLKTAQYDDDDVTLTATFRGYFDMNVAGRDWEFEYSAKISGDPDSDRVEVEQPGEMPDDLWGQVWEQIEDKAREVAENRYLQKVNKA